MATTTPYQYTKVINLDRMTMEIRSSSIAVSLDHIQVDGTNAVTIIFRDILSTDDQTTLDTIVSTHVPIPLPENTILSVAVQSQPALTVIAQPPYGSKTITVGNGTKKLYARFTGVQFSVSQGSNTLNYVVTYAWAKLLGIEVVNCEALDNADLKVYDTASGTYSGVPNLLLNQFSYTINLPKDFYVRMAQFDADIYAGMVIQITYVSQSAKTIGLNLLIDEVKS